MASPRPSNQKRFPVFANVTQRRCNANQIAQASVETGATSHQVIFQHAKMQRKRRLSDVRL